MTRVSQRLGRTEPSPDWDSVTENGTTENRTHTAAHEIETIDGNAVTHDAKGNLTSTADGRSFVWDFDNRLASATVGANSDGIEGTHSYTYDALGRRVTKTVNDAQAGETTTTLYVCAGQQVLCEYSVPTTGPPAANAPDQRFVYGAYVDEPILKDGLTNGTTGVVYYSRNQQYSVTALTNAAGSVIERYAYTAYGQTKIFRGSGVPLATSARQNEYTYTGRRADRETGLMYFRARMYDAQLGRFASRDPLGFVDGMSLYRGYFVPGSVDPSGLVWLPLAGTDEWQQHTSLSGSATVSSVSTTFSQLAVTASWGGSLLGILSGHSSQQFADRDAATRTGSVSASWNASIEELMFIEGNVVPELWERTRTFCNPNWSEKAAGFLAARIRTNKPEVTEIWENGTHAYDLLPDNVIGKLASVVAVSECCTEVTLTYTRWRVAGTRGATTNHFKAIRPGGNRITIATGSLQEALTAGYADIDRRANEWFNSVTDRY